MGCRLTLRTATHSKRWWVNQWMNWRSPNILVDNIFYWNCWSYYVYIYTPTCFTANLCKFNYIQNIYRVQYAAFVALHPSSATCSISLNPQKKEALFPLPAPLACIGSTLTQDASRHQNHSTFNRGPPKNPVEVLPPLHRMSYVCVSCSSVPILILLMWC